MLKIKPNLAIQDNYIISFATKVAEIHEDKIVELGKYSQITSKHIQYVSEQLKLPIVKATNKPVFDKLPVGTKII